MQYIALLFVAGVSKADGRDELSGSRRRCHDASRPQRDLTWPKQWTVSVFIVVVVKRFNHNAHMYISAFYVTATSLTIMILNSNNSIMQWRPWWAKEAIGEPTAKRKKEKKKKGKRNINKVVLIYRIENESYSCTMYTTAATSTSTSTTTKNNNNNNNK
jgi:hypothetical protein